MPTSKRARSWLISAAALTALVGCAAREGDDGDEESQALSSSVVTIAAAGSPAKGVYPTMELRVAGKTVKRWDAVKGNPWTRAFESFTYEHPTALDPSEVEVVFTNDYGDPQEDRNLFVDKVTIGARTFEAEAPETRTLAPTYCESGYLEREAMYCQGSMRFVDPELEPIMSRPRCPARPELGLAEGVFCTGSDYEASRDGSPIFGQLVGFIDEARRAKIKDPTRAARITAAFMSFSDPAIGDAMCKASAAGVEISVVLDKVSGASIPDSLRKPACKPEHVHYATLGGQTSGADEWRIFHIKMLVVDDGGPDLRFVFGSPNLYAGGYSTWFESWVFAHQPKTAHFAASHLCAVKALDAAVAAPAGQDVPAFSSTYASCTAAIAAPVDAKHRVFFAPDPSAKGRAELLARIQHASSSVDAAAYFLSDKQLAAALGDAAQAGKATRLLMDDSVLYDTTEGSAMASHATWETKLRPRIPSARFLATNALVWQLMHHKAVVIDRKSVFFGGGHFTTAAFTTNYDGFYLFDDPKLTRPFAEEIDRMYALAAPPGAHPAASTVRFTHAGDGRCLTIDQASTADDPNVVVARACDAAAAHQRFELRPESTGGYRIVAKHSGKCLDVWTAATGAGAAVGQHACGTQPNQLFFLTPADGAFRIVAAHSTLALGPTGSGDGAKIAQSAFASGAALEWTVTAE